MKLIPHNKPTLGRKEATAAANTVRSGWVAPGGPQTISFESELANHLGLEPKNVLAVSSGSAALYLALWALKTKIVTIPAYSCAAVTGAARLNKSVIKYQDSSEVNPNIDKYSLELGEDHSLIAVSNFGIPAEIDHKNSSRTIEDISQSFGAMAFERPIGTLGALGVTSFAATKVITTGGQGGAIFSSDSSLINAIRDFADFDMKADEVPRFNFLMSDVQASIGRVQLSRLDEFIHRRHEIYQIYVDAGLPLLPIGNFPNKPIRFRAVLGVENPLLLKEKLKKLGISAIVPYLSSEFFPSEVQAPLAHHWASSSLSIPIYPSLAMKDAKLIAQIVSDLLN